MTDDQIRDAWRKAKHRQLASGYATQIDRRNAATLRDRLRRGLALTPSQLDFLKRVEAIIAN